MISNDTYSLLDFGNAQRLEQWGKFRLIRPDPAATGAPATPASAQDAHVVGHADAPRPAIACAKQNAARNPLPPDRIRWILDDAPAFVARERRRNKKYDAIILDPPACGHSPAGKAWRVER